ncbi:MAG: hypothetical protein R3Y44_05505 [Rikenellaceae bacterium]
MKILLKTTFLALVCAIVCSCVGGKVGVFNKESYLESFENFITEIEAMEEASPSQLTEVKKSYLDYSETYYYKYQQDLSASESRTVDKLKIRYYKVMATYGLNEFGSEVEKITNKVVDFFNEITSEQ